MKTIRKYGNAADAGYDQSVIEAAGLTAMVIEDFSAKPGSKFATPVVLLQVNEADAQRALEILKAQDDPDSQPADIIEDDSAPLQNQPPPSLDSQTFVVTCPKCGIEWELNPQEARDKKFACTECSTTFPIINISALAGGWTPAKPYPQPDWRILRDYISQYFSTSEQPLVWWQAALQWVRAIRDVIGPEYDIYESKNFLILTAKSPGDAKFILNQCEQALTQIRNLLGPLAWRWTNGKHVIYMFEDLELYYGYVAPFYPDQGEFASSGGMFLNRGYCHTALPPCQKPVTALVHELTHLSLVQLRIPRWLNEGVAILTEDTVNGKKATRWDAELAALHKSHWNTETIQAFWSGKSFLDPDTSHVSYSLAQILVSNLREDFPNIIDFIKDAKVSDAGDSSALAHLGITLADIASSFLGPGEWAPRPVK